MNRSSQFVRRIDLSLDKLLLENEDSTSCIQKPNSNFLSKEQIDEHYDNHYQGYLKGLAAANEKIEATVSGEINHNGSDYRSALFDLGFNYNGVVLHENYFGSLGGKDLPDDLLKSLGLGDKDKLLQRLKATMMASKGWAFLGYDKRGEKCSVSLIDSHDCSVPLWRPVLALDVFEHAYYIDFKSDKEKYVDGILEDINWDVVGERLEKARQ